jgi:N-acetylmuramoyl-L-alanine amidase
VKTLVLDPGHGGADPGVVVGELTEAEITLAVALEVRAAVEALRWPVVVELTRKGNDETLSLAQRGALAKKYGADFVLALHVNSAPGAAQGAMGFFRAGDRCAKSIAARIVHSVPDRLFRANNMLIETRPGDWTSRAHHVVTAHPCPAVCFEMGFADDADDNAALRDAAVRRGLVAAVLCGVARFLEG